MGTKLENARKLYLEGIRDGNAKTAITNYAGDTYTQHSTGVKDGKEGFVEFFEDFFVRNPVREIELVRGFEDGPFVFLHAEQSLNDGEFRYVTGDIFNTDEQGRMIEHWDVIAEIEVATVSGHTQLDGPTEPEDLDKTEENKTLVRGFLNDVLKGCQYDRLADYISEENYIQHNPQIGDGLDGFRSFLESLSAQGQRMTYAEIHRVIGCGSFVASLSKMNLGEADMAVVDLFRVKEGRIVEHWDVMEEIPPEDEWVNSGKF